MINELTFFHGSELGWSSLHCCLGFPSSHKSEYFNSRTKHSDIFAQKAIPEEENKQRQSATMLIKASHLWNDKTKTFHEGHGVVRERGGAAVQAMGAPVQPEFGVHLG